MSKGSSMSVKSELAGLLADYAAYFIFAGGLVVSWVTGRSYQRFRVEQLRRDMKRVREEMDAMRAEMGKNQAIISADATEQAVQIGALTASIQALNKNLDRMHEDLRQKADRE